MPCCLGQLSSGWQQPATYAYYEYIMTVTILTTSTPTGPINCQALGPELRFPPSTPTMDNNWVTCVVNKCCQVCVNSSSVLPNINHPSKPHYAQTICKHVTKNTPTAPNTLSLPTPMCCCFTQGLAAQRHFQHPTNLLLCANHLLTILGNNSNLDNVRSPRQHLPSPITHSQTQLAPRGAVTQHHVPVACQQQVPVVLQLRTLALF
jgi:hypothetical protein